MVVVVWAVLGISERADFLGFSCTKVSKGYKEWGNKQQKNILCTQSLHVEIPCGLEKSEQNYQTVVYSNSNKHNRGEQ